MKGEAFDFAIVGGGIAGLTAAHEILRLHPRSSLILLESTERLGGNIRTTREDDFTVEWGVNGFLDNVPETLELISRIGLTSDLLPAAESAGKRFIFRDGRLREVPMKPPRFLVSDLLTPMGRLRVLGEPFARPRPSGDETVFDFAARRIGREAAAILVDAMVSGVYAGDSRTLSLASTFPRMMEMEEKYGSLFRAMIALRRDARRGLQGAREEGRRRPDGGAGGAGEPVRRGGPGGPGGPGGVLTSLRGGMGRLVIRLAERIGSERLRIGTAVLAVEPSPGRTRYRLRAATAAGTNVAYEARRVIVAAPARAAARFLAPLDSTLARELEGIVYAPLAVVAFAYKHEDLDQVPNGFGFLAPHGQGLRILGCLWDSSIFPPRAPKGWVLIRGMIGGACDPEAVELSDPDLEGAVRHDLALSMGVRATPRKTWIFRHPLGIPQYTIGHGARLERIDARLVRLPGLLLVGNSYHGVAVNGCVKEAAGLGSWIERDSGEQPVDPSIRPAIATGE